MTNTFIEKYYRNKLYNDAIKIHGTTVALKTKYNLCNNCKIKNINLTQKSKQIFLFYKNLHGIIYFHSGYLYC